MIDIPDPHAIHVVSNSGNDVAPNMPNSLLMSSIKEKSEDVKQTGTHFTFAFGLDCPTNVLTRENHLKCCKLVGGFVASGKL